MNNLMDIIGKFNERKIVVMGDAILDKFTYGKIVSLNPEQPAALKIMIKPESTYKLGGAANVANNVISLGAKSLLYAVVGEDSSGKILSNLLNDKWINAKLWMGKNVTPTKERVIAHGQQVVRLDYGEWNLSKIDNSLENEILKELRNDLEGYDGIILSDYDKGFFSKSFSQEIIKLANSKSIPTIVDAKPQNWRYFKNCTVIRSNEKEAEKMSGVKYERDSSVLNYMAQKIRSKINPEKIVITCGTDGVFFYDCKTEKSSIEKTVATRVVDVTGAGDTFVAALALGLTSNIPLEKAVKIANYAAGVVVGKVGTSTTSSEEIIQKMGKE